MLLLAILLPLFLNARYEVHQERLPKLQTIPQKGIHEELELSHRIKIHFSLNLRFLSNPNGLDGIF